MKIVVRGDHSDVNDPERTCGLQNLTHSRKTQTHGRRIYIAPGFLPLLYFQQQTQKDIAQRFAVLGDIGVFALGLDDGYRRTRR